MVRVAEICSICLWAAADIAKAFVCAFSERVTPAVAAIRPLRFLSVSCCIIVVSELFSRRSVPR